MGRYRLVRGSLHAPRNGPPGSLGARPQFPQRACRQARFPDTSTEAEATPTGHQRRARQATPPACRRGRRDRPVVRSSRSGRREPGTSARGTTGGRSPHPRRCHSHCFRPGDRFDRPCRRSGRDPAARPRTGDRSSCIRAAGTRFAAGPCRALPAARAAGRCRSHRNQPCGRPDACRAGRRRARPRRAVRDDRRVSGPGLRRHGHARRYARSSLCAIADWSGGLGPLPRHSDLGLGTGQLARPSQRTADNLLATLEVPEAAAGAVSAASAAGDVSLAVVGGSADSAVAP